MLCDRVNLPGGIVDFEKFIRMRVCLQTALRDLNHVSKSVASLSELSGRPKYFSKAIKSGADRLVESLNVHRRGRPISSQRSDHHPVKCSYHTVVWLCTYKGGDVPMQGVLKEAESVSILWVGQMILSHHAKRFSAVLAGVRDTFRVSEEVCV